MIFRNYLIMLSTFLFVIVTAALVLTLLFGQTIGRG
jgi:hypothetical protein